MRLQKINPRFADEINDVVFLRQTPRHAPDARYFKGLGLPMPVKGSRRITSIKSKARSKILQLVSAQNRKSSRNSG